MTPTVMRVRRAHAGKGGKPRFATPWRISVNTIAYGGDSAFAAMVDATLGDPRGWTSTGDFEFIHVAADDKPDTRIRLTSLATTAKLCGAQLNTETSCHTGITGESTVNLNESRWVRGAVPFEGDLGNYRQYLINHEFGHAIGYASHQACGGGKLAPVMMQQTLSLNNAELYRKDSKEIYPDEDVTCEPNPWPYPNPRIRIRTIRNRRTQCCFPEHVLSAFHAEANFRQIRGEVLGPEWDHGIKVGDVVCPCQ